MVVLKYSHRLLRLHTCVCGFQGCAIPGRPYSSGRRLTQEVPWIRDSQLRVLKDDLLTFSEKILSLRRVDGS
ncbi:MAG: hypothetical protein QXE79_03370, partial [Candidatus Bathyarchaeia archaeon]